MVSNDNVVQMDLVTIITDGHLTVNKTNLGNLVLEGLWISGTRKGYNLGINALVDIYDGQYGVVALVRGVHLGMDPYRQELKPEEIERLRKDVYEHAAKYYDLPDGAKVRLAIDPKWGNEMASYRLQTKRPPKQKGFISRML